MIGSEPVVLPLSWWSYARAASFTGILIVFGGGAAFGSTGALRFLGAAFVVIGIGAGSDFAVFTRHRRLVEQQVPVPRASSPNRTVPVVQSWRRGIDDVGHRDSMFGCQTVDVDDRVTPNLMVARSDVKQWLFPIGEATAAR